MYQPKIVAFFCNWCTYSASDLAGSSRLETDPGLRIIRVMCSGRVDPQFVLQAFQHGADGVLIGGCHPGDCHYEEGNMKALKRFGLLKRVLRQMGVEEERFRLEWISSSEAKKLKQVVDDMAGELARLGPFAPEKESRHAG